MGADDASEFGEVRGPPRGPTGHTVWTGESRPVTSAGARTPEELETLFEDGLLMRDHLALATLFEAGATLVTDDEQPVRGGAAIARAALATREGVGTYVADPRRVLLARNIALVVTDQGVNVMHRGDDGAWRYAIVLHVRDGGE